MNVIADNTELAENFAETVKHEIETDDDTYAHIGFHLANNIRNQSPASEVLLTLCGWTIETLLDKTPPIAIDEGDTSINALYKEKSSQDLLNPIERLFFYTEYKN